MSARPSDFRGVPMLTRLPSTVDCEPHAPQPQGYVVRAEWMEMMGETHDVRQCRGCGLWLIWEPKGNPR